MSTIRDLGRNVRSAARRRSLDRTVVHLHPAVRDEVLDRSETDAR